MRRSVIALTAALVIIGPLTMSKLGHSQIQEKATETKDEGKGKREAGKALYEEHCQLCHGDKGQGNLKIYKRVGAAVVHLGSKQAQEKSDEQIRKTMTEGFGKMSKIEAFPELTAENLDDIVAYVRTLKLEEAKK